MKIRFDEKTGHTGGGETEIMVQWLIRNTTPDDVFFDVGCHLGYSSIPVIQKKNPYFSILVEPDSYTCKMLKENLEKNISNKQLDKCVIIEKMVMDKVGVSKYYKFPLSCHNSIINRNWNKTEIEKQTTTIDDLVREFKIDRPIVLKIDVESAEPYVWKGLKKSIPLIKVVNLEFAPWHYAEDSKYIPNLIKPEDFIKEIEADGFKVFDYNDNPLKEEHLYTNADGRFNICLKK